jgi:Tfp pilus assembly protein PilN
MIYDDTPRRGASPTALALVVLAVLLLVGFQTFQLVRERDLLTQSRASLEPTVQEMTRMRQQLDSLAGRTAKLAEAGNANAKQILEDMRRQGIAVKPPQ